MTVCIVARSYGALFLVSDRMITSGDTQFEPPAQKIIFVTSSIALMFSGDAAFHIEIMQDVMKEVHDRVLKEPQNWWRVRDVVDIYLKYRNLAKLKRAEAAILAPLNLDRNSFLEKQKMMSPELVERISNGLVNFEIPDVTVIVAGLDKFMGESNTHIFSIHNDYVSNDTVTGFRAIGSGARHAESLFMLARHTWNSEISDTVLRIYCAKRNAETAPGVGAETDMFMIGPEVGQHTIMRPDLMEKLETEFKKIKIGTSKIQEEANLEMKKYVEGLGQKEPVAQDTKPSPEEGKENVSNR